MHIISWNVNSLRAMVRKLPKTSLSDFMLLHNADIYCFQETKLSQDQLEPTLHFIEGYESFWAFSTVKKGYSGVATYARTGITIDAETSLGESRFDDEGRMIITDHHSFVLFNVYFPNSGGTPERLKYKLDFYNKFQEKCDEIRQKGRHVIVVGDVNTAFEDIDLWNAQVCLSHYGETLFVAERKWMKQWYESGFVDALRKHHPGESGFYSWFDPLDKDARKLNKGWRLDYTILDNELADSDLLEAGVSRPKSTEDDNLSDHIPVYIKLKPQPPVPPHPTPKLSSALVQKKRPSIKSFFTAAPKKPPANKDAPTTTSTTTSTTTTVSTSTSTLSPSTTITPTSTTTTTETTSNGTSQVVPSNDPVTPSLSPSTTSSPSTSTTNSLSTPKEENDSSTTAKLPRDGSPLKNEKKKKQKL